jgi:hypothetical protein
MLEHVQRTFMLLQFWPHLQVQLQRDVSIFRRVAPASSRAIWLKVS